jgi:hypothetical protein
MCVYESTVWQGEEEKRCIFLFERGIHVFQTCRAIGAASLLGTSHKGL